MSLTLPKERSADRSVTRRAALSVRVPRDLLRLVVYLVLGVQVYRGVSRPLDAFSESYWLVNYGQGFVRRGMTGSVLNLLVGHPTPASVRAAAFVITAVAVVSLLAVVELLLRHTSDRAAALAVLLAASPVTASYLAFQRRPDQLAVPLLVLLGIALLRGGRAARLGPLLVGAAFGFLVLAHEGVVLEDVPWAVVLVLVLNRPPAGAGRGSRRVPEPGIRRSRSLPGTLGGLVGPALVATIGVTLFGGVNAATALRLRAHEAFHPSGPTNGFTMFDFLPQSLHSAVSFVAHGAKRDHVAMLALGVLLLGLHRWWVQRWAGVRVGADLSARRGPHIAALTLAGVTVASAALFLTGIDWLRWFAALGLAWLITAAFALIARERDAPPDAGVESPGRHASVHLPVLLLVVGAYLLAVPPLPTAADAHGVLRLLLLRG